jgi:hypothetical protein
MVKKYRNIPIPQPLFEHVVKSGYYTTVEAVCLYLFLVFSTMVRFIFRIYTKIHLKWIFA